MNKVLDALNVGKSNLISAKALFGQYCDSVTMSYYAMYSVGLVLLLKKDISPGTHGETMRQLAKEYVKTGLLSKKLMSILMVEWLIEINLVMTIQQYSLKKWLKNMFLKQKDLLMRLKHYYNFFFCATDN